MENHILEKLKFPIGQFTIPDSPTLSQINQWIDILEAFPKQIETITTSLSTAQLQWKYRPDGWSIKQVVHHCADSHMNSIIRFKLALTEETPTIKPYEEGDWALLSDSQSDDLTASKQIIYGVHHRLVALLKSLTDTQFNRTFYHPGSNMEITLAQNTALYAWHSQHHYAHIEQALNNEGAF